MELILYMENQIPENVLGTYIASRPKDVDLSEDDIVSEVSNIRYNQWESSLTPIYGFRFLSETKPLSLRWQTFFNLYTLYAEISNNQCLLQPE